jgi:ubiquinone/menaquinone biosynthesis C-methylase UbiE
MDAKLPEVNIVNKAEDQTHKAAMGTLRTFLVSKCEEFARMPLPASNQSLLDFLAPGRSATEVAEHFGWNNLATQRMLRGFTGAGILKYDKAGQTFLPSPTPIQTSNPLPLLKAWLQNIVPDLEIQKENYSPNIMGVAYYYKTVVARYLEQPSIIKGLETGKSTAEIALGIGNEQIFDHYGSNPELLKIYSGSFAVANERGNLLALENLHPSPGDHVLDVGGGAGDLAKLWVRKHPEIGDVTVYDLPNTDTVLETSRAKQSAESKNKIKWAYGSFFNETNFGGLEGLNENEQFNFITFGWILHDWYDEQNIEILERAKKHLAPGGKIIILERILDPEKTGPLAFNDFIMMLMASGFERTKDEYQKLFETVGLEIESHSSWEACRDMLVLKVK